MADEKEQKEQEASGALNKTAASAGGTKGKLMAVAGLCAAVVVVSAAAGAIVNKMMNAPEPAAAATAEKDAGHEKEKHGKSPAEDSAAAPLGGELKYVDFEPVIVNLNEPRLGRFIRATVVLAIAKDDFNAAEKRIKSTERELKSWLTVYFASCTPEDVRGDRNLNRIRREIEEAFNDQLWHNSKPLISHVLFKEFAIQ